MGKEMFWPAIGAGLLIAVVAVAVPVIVASRHHSGVVVPSNNPSAIVEVIRVVGGVPPKNAAVF